MFGFKRKRRQRLRNQPFPSTWLAIIEKNVPYFMLLSLEDQEELKGHIQIFLDEKKYEGIDGLEITDEIRVTIAAQACVLLLHRETDYYPKLISIVVYPHQYRAQASRRLPEGIVEESIETRLGESWYRGDVVLSWDDVLRGATDFHDGHNVVFHEFAHQLDSETGRTNGAPALPHPSMYKDWARVMTSEYEQLIDDVKTHRRTLLRKYGAENPAEFFAVITEAFFEQPIELKDKHPELYEQLMIYYNQDPFSRFIKIANQDNTIN